MHWTDAYLLVVPDHAVGVGFGLSLVPWGCQGTCTILMHSQGPHQPLPSEPSNHLDDCSRSPLPCCHYPSIEYLPCFAAAGRNLQFYAISWSNGMAAAPRAISSCYDLATTWPGHATAPKQ